MSLAYADGLAVAVVAEWAVGVDVELEGPAPEGFGSREEWTAYEAVAKLTGEGVRRDPRAGVPVGAVVRSFPDLPPGYLGSLATWR